MCLTEKNLHFVYRLTSDYLFYICKIHREEMDLWCSGVPAIHTLQEGLCIS